MEPLVEEVGASVAVATPNGIIGLRLLVDGHHLPTL